MPVQLLPTRQQHVPGFEAVAAAAQDSAAAAAPLQPSCEEHQAAAAAAAADRMAQLLMVRTAPPCILRASWP